LAVGIAAVGIAACDAADEEEPTTSAGGSSSGGAGGQAGVAGAGGEGGAVCGSADGEVSPSWLELAHDDGEPFTHVREQSWTITVGLHTYTLAEEVLSEAVRFELEHPARIHGFKLMWADLPEDVDPLTPIEAGLFGDFGYNGFDFWPEAIWQGDRCAGDIAEGQWVSYVLDEPLTVEHPGLVYVAHHISGPTDPVWPFDETVTGEGDCAAFDDCTSAMNLPEVETSSYYNGLSFPFQYDYLVRLYVEYTDDLEPAERIFQPVADSPSSRHVSFGDYDDDGYDDLLLSGPTLYRNEGDGTFTDVTASSGLAALSLGATGGVWGDYDNDGCLDLFAFAESHTKPDALLRSNCDGTFSDVTAEAGIVDEQSYNDCDSADNIRSPTAAAAWLDIDSDGLLDLYLANFICWSDYTFYRDTVFRNQGDGSFAEWTAAHGFSDRRTPSRGASPIDHDGDGDVDLFVNNYTLKSNLFFENEGDGTVTEMAVDVGLAGEMIQFYFGHTIGAAWGDLDGDGHFDMIHANLAHPRFFDFSDKSQVLLNDGSGQYADISGDWTVPASEAGLRYQETHSVPVLADFDHDGALDLVLTCVYDGRPTDFYWGNGDGTFSLDAYHAGITTENGWGAAAADVDNDGDPDLFATTLFENTMDGAAGHWLQVRAVGNVASNWAALGATIRVTAGGETRIRHVTGGTGKGGQDSQFVHFGLGDETSIDSIEVDFPGGGTVSYSGPLTADQRIWLYEDGDALGGWAPPK